MNKGYGRKELLEYLLKVGANVPWLERLIFGPAKFLVVLVYVGIHLYRLFLGGCKYQ